MNNKGFAITSIIYGLMLLFVVVISSFLSILVGRNRRMDELINGVYESVDYEQEEVNSGDDFINKDSEGNIIGTGYAQGAYVTEKRGLYKFDINGTTCNVYLPKSVVLITGEAKKLDDADDKNKLYYIVNGGENPDDYKALKCLN